MERVSGPSLAGKWPNKNKNQITIFVSWLACYYVRDRPPTNEADLVCTPRATGPPEGRPNPCFLFIDGFRATATLTLVLAICNQGLGRSRTSSIFGVSTGPIGLQTPPKRCRAPPSTFWRGFWGRPDPQHRRFPAGPKTMY